MKYSALFAVFIGLMILVSVVLGILVHRECITAAFGQYVMLSLTLIGILFYAFYTYRSLRLQQERFQWDQNPTLGSYIEPELVKKRQGDSVDFSTIFHIQNFSRVHAVAKIDIHPKLDGRVARSNGAYFGESWWYVPAKKKIDGHFSLVKILKSHSIHLGDFEQKKIPLTLEIKIVYKRWEQKQDKPMLENPPDRWSYNHEKYKWIHEPTTDDLQFPMFSEQV